MTFAALQPIVDQLPFHIDDTQQANATFARWHEKPSDQDRRLIDLWTYAYVYRYFLIKLVPSRRATSAAFDQLVSSAFTDVQKNLHQVRQPDRFTSWVGTICRNAFINYLRTRRSTISLEDGHPVLTTEADATAPMQAHDAGVVYRTVYAAIEALPPFLREVAHLRLLERCSYEAISKITGKPAVHLRVYLNRALTRLRRDPDLRALLHELRD